MLATLLLLASSALAADTHPSIEPGTESGEDWKGNAPKNEFEVGGLSGLGIYGYNAGFAVLGTAAKKITQRGFITDINDTVNVEVEAGAIFLLGTAAFMYGAHLRWDFHKDSMWSFYALGGVGGSIAGSTLAGPGTSSQFLLYPRFGVGSIYHLNANLALRAEVSHELMALGVVFPL